METANAYEWDFVALIPSREMSTKEAKKKSFPETIERSLVVKNLCISGSLIGGLQSGNEKLLKQGLKDHIHQPYRLPLIQRLQEAKDLAIELGAIRSISKRLGSTLMSVIKKDMGDDFVKN